MPIANRLNRRVHEIGKEIFELADAAEPRFWKRAWWLDRMIQLVDRDPVLRTHAFQFVDCLPSLRTHGAIVQHLAEYFDERVVEIPRLFRAFLRPGRLRAYCENLIGLGARFGATQMAGRFITGYDTPSVIKTLQHLRREGKAESSVHYVGHVMVDNVLNLG